MNESFLDRHAFLLRRLHSLSGVAPIGVFLMIHLTTNASIMWGLVQGDKYGDLHAGAVTFQHEVDFIHSMPALLLIEIFGLWLPIAFHAGLGVVYAIKGKNNVQRYSGQNNWRYFLQRATAWIGLFFIVWHVATLRWGWSFLVPGGTQWSAQYAGSTLAAVFRGQYVEGGVAFAAGDGEFTMTPGGVLVSVVYMVGVTALVFHLANGLWTAAITWGITLSARAQKRWGYVCAAIGVGLMGAGWAAIIGYMTLDYDEALAAEKYLQKERAVDDDNAGTMVRSDDRGGIASPASYEDTTENEQDSEGAHR